jgi:hypothetical protein
MAVTHKVDRRGVRNGTATSAGRRPSRAAVRRSISRAVSTSGPGRSKQAEEPSSGSVRAATSAATTSSRAIGSVRLPSQRGSTIAGSRAARSRRMRQLALPAPTITLARSSSVGTAPARRMRPVSRRLARCGDDPPAGAIPPR